MAAYHQAYDSYHPQADCLETDQLWALCSTYEYKNTFAFNIHCVSKKNVVSNFLQ